MVRDGQNAAVRGVVSQLAFGLSPAPLSAARRRTIPAIRPRIVAHGDHAGHSGNCGSHCGHSRKVSVRTAASSGACLAASAGIHLTGIGGSIATLAYGIPLTVSVLLAGVPALKDAWATLRKGSIGVDVLMTAAAAAALVSGAPFEGALLLTLFALSHAAEAAVTARARAHLDKLETLSPDDARLLVQPATPNSPPTETSVSADQLKPGNRILLKHSELLPADATMERESAYWSLAHLTGESTPRRFRQGEMVPAGAILMPPSSPVITLRVIRVQAESSLSRITSLVHKASSTRSKLHSSLLSTFGEVYSNVVLFTCLLISLWPTPSVASLRTALSVLIAASPCALVVGAPVAYVAALSAAVRRGVLIKDGPSTMERLASMTDIAFDKTGTLTTGKLRLEKVLLYPEHGEDIAQETQALAIAAAMESSSPSHPVADALLLAAGEKKIVAKPLRGVVKPVPGQGLSAETDGYCIGRLPWVLDHVEPNSGVSQWLNEAANSAQQKGSPVSWMVFGDGQAAVFVFADMVRPEALTVMKKLRGPAGGFDLSILTGDRASAAATVASALEFEPHSVRADCSPEQKLNAIQSAGPGLIMVGDGINDAPALAAAPSSVSMGLENATAVFASDVVLTRSNLDDLRWLLAKSRSARKIAWQNVILGLTFMVMTATPALMGWIPLWASVLLHEGGTVVVGLNGLRLLSDRLS